MAFRTVHPLVEAASAGSALGRVLAAALMQAPESRARMALLVEQLNQDRARQALEERLLALREQALRLQMERENAERRRLAAEAQRLAAIANLSQQIVTETDPTKIREHAMRMSAVLGRGLPAPPEPIKVEPGQFFYDPSTGSFFGPGEDTTLYGMSPLALLSMRTMSALGNVMMPWDLARIPLIRTPQELSQVLAPPATAPEPEPQGTGFLLGARNFLFGGGKPQKKRTGRFVVEEVNEPPPASSGLLGQPELPFLQGMEEYFRRNAQVPDY